MYSRNFKSFNTYLLRVFLKHYYGNSVMFHLQNNRICPFSRRDIGVFVDEVKTRFRTHPHSRYICAYGVILCWPVLSDIVVLIIIISYFQNRSFLGLIWTPFVFLILYTVRIVQLDLLTDFIKGSTTSWIGTVIILNST